MVYHPSPRAIAVEIINDLEIKKGFSNFTLNNYFKRLELRELDKSFISELVYGYLRWKYRLTWQLSLISNREINKIPDIIRIIILVGFYQIEFLDKVPDSAAVNESVNLAKKYGNKRVAGFVNGVLRNYIRKKETLPVPEDLINKLAIKYSFLPENIKRWSEYYDYKTLENILIGLNKHIPTTIRINTLKGKFEDIYKGLIAEGLVLDKEEGYNYCFRVVKGSPQNTSAFKNGAIHIQSLSSAKVVEILAPQKGEFILDVCSAPGGKTSYISQLMENTGKIFAWDVYPHRVKLVKKTCERLGATNVIAEVVDGTKELPNISVDRVLIDAPCSGTGVITNKPEIKWIELDRIMEGLNKTQYLILENSSRLLKPGGILVYSTCSIDKGENKDIIDKFLKNNKKFKLESIDNFYPHIHNSEGFFICKMRKL